MKLFCILDVKGNFFLQPFAEPSTVNAIRSFDLAVNTDTTTFHKFPDDFALMELGEFDVHTGALKVLPAPLNIATGRSLLKNNEQLELPVDIRRSLPNPNGEVRQ